MVALDEGATDDERVPASLLDRMAFLVDLTDVALGDVDHPASWPGPAPSPTSPPSWPGLSRPSATWSPAKIEVVGGRAEPGHDDSGSAHNGPPPPGDSAAIEALCGAALALGIDSVRAPLFALRAARTAASLDGRSRIEQEDLALAAALVLAPRATRLPAGDEPAPEPEPEPETPPEAQDDDNPDPEALPDTPLEDLVLEAALASLPPDLLAQLAQLDGGRGAVRAPGRAGQAKLSFKRGRPIGTRQGEPRNGARLHLLETLKAAAPWQSLRRRPGSDRFQVRRDDFRIIRFKQRIGTTTVFAVDASGSAAMQRLSEAKGAVELLLADCYVRRDQVAMLAFRGPGAQVLLPPTGSLLRAKRSLAGLPGGGGTPLALGIEAALALADSVRRSGRTPVIAILTDARANIARDGSGGRPRAEADALDSARAIRSSGIATLLVDTSPRPNPFARKLADAMGARYVPLPYADPSALSKAVRTASAA
jgi:magnesium chelatase subunit D